VCDAADLDEHGQGHLLAGIDELDPPVRERFVARLREIDWEELAHPAVPPPIENVEASRVVRRGELGPLERDLRSAGEAAFRNGAVAVLMVAGGQGTRLGFPGPKGCLPLAPHSGKTIYGLQAEKVLALSRRVGSPVPLLVLTSPSTDGETRAFFTDHERFGLEKGQVQLFCQGTVPSVDRKGRALLAAPGTLLENPDGHGGTFTALVRSGQLGRLRREGVTSLVYIQVDNVLAPIDDPLFVGLGLVERANVVTKVLPKRDPDEKVGHLVRVDGRDRVIEYTELTPEDTRRRGPDGEIVYRWGSPAMHLWSVEFLSRLAERGFRPPLHRSPKPLTAWLEGEHRRVEGFKYERFIFDLLPEAETSLGLEIERGAEFAPVKNATGENSPETAVAAMHAQYRDWLEAAGVQVSLPPGGRIEISPLFAATKQGFLERWDGRVTEIRSDYYLEEE